MQNSAYEYKYFVSGKRIQNSFKHDDRGFCQIVTAVNYFCKKLHLRQLTEFCIRSYIKLKKYDIEQSYAVQTINNSLCKIELFR